MVLVSTTKEMKSTILHLDHYICKLPKLRERIFYCFLACCEASKEIC